ncbi:MAG: outer membrane beta-barrel protein [Hyphomicrobium sp.]
MKPSSTSADHRRPRRDAQAFACAAAAAAFSAAPFSGALAIDVDYNADLITDTIASQEIRKDWMEARKYGAQTVAEADRGFAAPEGIRMGNFFIYPSITETIAYDSNIYGLADDPIADWRFITAPTLTIQSQLPRHYFDMTVFGRFMNFAENTDQNYANFGGAARGAVHIDHAHTFSVSAVAKRDHEERSAITASLAAAEPVPVDQFRASVGLTRDVGRLYGTVSATAEKLDYHSVPAIGGGTLSQAYRDQELYAAQLRAGYRISPGFDFVANLRGIKQFNEPEAPGLGNRNSEGYEISAGLAFETDPLVRWRLLGGYGMRDYERSDLGTVSTSLLEAQVTWLATDRLTLSATASRNIADDFGAEDSGRIETSAIASADYEIRHDLFATANVGFANVDFIGSTREDEVFEAGASLRYHYTKNMLFTLGYTYETRDSNDPSFDFDRSIVRVGGTLKF